MPTVPSSPGSATTRARYGSKSTIGDSKSKAADLQAYIEEQNALQDKIKAEIDEIVAEISPTNPCNPLPFGRICRREKHGWRQ